MVGVAPLKGFAGSASQPTPAVTDAVNGIELLSVLEKPTLNMTGAPPFCKVTVRSPGGTLILSNEFVLL